MATNSLFESIQNYFGFNLKTPESNNVTPSFIAPQEDQSVNRLEAFASFMDYSPFGNMSDSRSEINLISRYRVISQYPEIETAIDDIVNEAIVTDGVSSVKINLDKCDPNFITENISKKISDEFEIIKNLLEFDNRGYFIFKRWYVDGRIYFHKMIDMKNPKEGIKEVRYIDPRKIKKIVVEKTVKKDGIELIVIDDEYYRYNNNINQNFTPNRTSNQNNNQNIKISKDSIAFVGSGIMDETDSMMLSFLHKTIRSINQLRAMEDAGIIYQIARAPERRIFEIPTGDMPPAKAQEYVRKVMQSNKSKMVYDTGSGSVHGENNFMNILDDFYIAKRDGESSANISNLPPGSMQNTLELIEYFKKSVYKSLGVPISRLEVDTGFALGRASEITRDEIKFSKFISRLRRQFSFLFLDLLKTQLILKNIITPDEWNNISQDIFFDFIEDNHFSELKDAEIFNSRVNVASLAEPFVGKYVSNRFIRKNILMQSEQDIIEQDKEIKKEKNNPQYQEIDPTLGIGSSNAAIADNNLANDDSSDTNSKEANV